MVLLHGHYSIAGDSRDFITSAQSHPRAITVDVIHNFMRWARGEAITKENFHDNAIFGANAMTYCLKALHGYPKACAVWYRDSLLQVYDPTTFAMVLYKGTKTPHNEMGYVSSYRARKQSKHPGRETSLTVVDVANGLSCAPNKKALWKYLDDYDSKIVATLLMSNVAKKWHQIYEYLSKFVTTLGDDHIKEWAEKRDVRLAKGDTSVTRERTFSDPDRQETRNEHKSVEERMIAFKYDPDVVQYCWVQHNKKESTYVGDTKNGWPVFTPNQLTNVYKRIKSKVPWALELQKRKGKGKEAKWYAGSPRDKDTGEEIPRDESDHLGFYKFVPKEETPAEEETPAACPQQNTRKKK